MNFSRIIGKAAILLSIATCASAQLFAQQSADKSILSIERNKKDNTPKVVRFSSDSKLSATQPQAIFQKYLEVTGINNRMLLSTTTKINGGMIVDRYVQYFKDIKIQYSSAIVASKEGAVGYITSNVYHTDNSTSAAAALSESVALKYALDLVHAEKYMWESPAQEAFLKKLTHNKDTSYFPHGQLVWIEDYSKGVKNGNRELHLAYEFSVFAAKPMSNQEIFIDAATGKVLFTNNLIKHAVTFAPAAASKYSGAVRIETENTGSTHILNDLLREGKRDAFYVPTNGVHTMTADSLDTGDPLFSPTEITDVTNSWTGPLRDSVAIDAQWGGEMVFDYWKDVHLRASYDNDSATMTQIVHYDTGLNNAFWNGMFMSYGDGTGCGTGGFTSLAALDVVGHELGHAICQYTANLVYEGESGAMNEGFSDCWGASIENRYDPHESDVVSKSTWLIGEELGCGTPLRHMDFPKLSGDPDTYYGINFFDVSTCGPPDNSNDQCGVHRNSGVLNKWYYLLTNPAPNSGVNDNGDAYSVDGIGFGDAERILYATELTLGSTDGYNDCRTASILAAEGIFGACTPQVKAVTDAWYAVGVGPSFIPCVPSFSFVNASDVADAALTINEYAGTPACPAAKSYIINVKPVGTDPITGTANVTFNVAGIPAGSYILSAPALTWTAGTSMTKSVTLTIFDNGAVNDDRNFTIGLTVSGITNAIASAAFDTLNVKLENDDPTPQVGVIEYHTLDQGATPNIVSNLTSAFPGESTRARSQFMLFAWQLTAAGVRPGTPISQIAFNVVEKNTTGPYVNYSIYMGNTSAPDLSTAFINSALLTPVYNGNYTTTLGINAIDFNQPGSFAWNGIDNVVVQICYGRNAAAAVANDKMEGVENSTIYACDHVGTTGGPSSTGCGLAFSSGGLGTARPVMRFKQVLPIDVETVVASTHAWDVKAGQEVYFYNTADTGTIAGLNNVTQDLGCAGATITQAGNGFIPAAFSFVNKSKKEITITPTTNGSTAAYDVTMYFTRAELGTIIPASLYLVKTNELTDATIDAANSSYVTPSVSTWTSGTTNIAFTGHFTGVGRYFLTDGPLCTKPAPSITAGGPTSFCPGGSVLLSANTGAGYKYQWNDGATIISGATNSTYTASTPGNYNVTEYSGLCNDVSASVSVSYAPPYAGVIIVPAGVCTGRTITLSNAVTGGTWTSANTLIATIDPSTGDVTGVTAGTATISYDINNACGAATTTSVVVVSAPIAVAPITGPASICLGAGTLSLSNTTPSGVWSSGNSVTATVSSTGVVTTYYSGMVPISYSVTNAFGCVSSAVANISIDAAPTAAITAPGVTTLCPGGTSSLLLNASFGTGYTYQWKVGGTNIPGATSMALTVSAPGTYSVRVLDVTGCSTLSGGAVITVSGTTVVPVVNITATPGTTVCTTGTPVAYNASSTFGGSAPVYTWYVNGTTAGAGSFFSYIPAHGDVVSIKLKSNAACAIPDTAINAVTMSVGAFFTPSVGVVSSTSGSICAGTINTFSVVPSFGGATPSYQWWKNGVPVATGPSYSYAPANGDNITCQMTSSMGCVTAGTVASMPVIMSVRPSSVNTATITVKKTTGSNTYSVVAPHAGLTPSFQWYVDGVAVPGATSGVFTATTLTDGQLVTCSVTSSDPCTSPSTAYSNSLRVLIGTGASSLGNASNNFTLVPNPTKGEFTISGALKSAQDNNVNIVITDMLGQVVYRHTAQAQNGSLNEKVSLARTLANGMYMVNVTSGTDHQVFHVVLDK